MRPTNNGGFTVNKQQRRVSNPRPSGREASTLPPRHGSTIIHMKFVCLKQNTCNILQYIAAKYDKGHYLFNDFMKYKDKARSRCVENRRERSFHNKTHHTTDIVQIKNRVILKTIKDKGL